MFRSASLVLGFIAEGAVVLYSPPSNVWTMFLPNKWLQIYEDVFAGRLGLFGNETKRLRDMLVVDPQLSELRTLFHPSFELDTHFFANRGTSATWLARELFENSILSAIIRVYCRFSLKNCVAQKLRPKVWPPNWARILRWRQGLGAPPFCVPIWSFFKQIGKKNGWWSPPRQILAFSANTNGTLHIFGVSRRDQSRGPVVHSIINRCFRTLRQPLNLPSISG